MPSWAEDLRTALVEDVNNPSSALGGALGAASVAAVKESAAFRPRDARTVGICSNSIGNGAAGAVNADLTRGQAFRHMLPAVLDGRIRPVVSNSVAGENSTQIRARLPNLLATGVGHVILGPAGTNDADDAAARATFADNLIAMIGMCRAAGVTPIVVTDPPVNAKASMSAAHQRIARKIAADYDTPLIDFYAATVSATGGFKSGYDYLGDGGGVHPSATGHMAMSWAAADVLDRIVPRTRIVPLALDNNDPSNLMLTTALHTVETSTGSGIPAGWVTTGPFTNGNNITRSLVANTAGPGNLRRSVFTGVSGGYLYDARGLPAGYYSVGDTLDVSAMVNILSSSELDQVDGTDGIGIRVDATVGGSTVATWIAGPWTAATSRPLIMSGQYVVPTGTTNLTLGVWHSLEAGETLSAEYGQVSVYKR